ncbi:MAG: ribosomal L7Ae/L30e/S12e/Gadd45 family protein [Gemmatimonadetes bacterium]|nr:ribosomal L7Ae/L30e/S12e/Gadd45 family protein [Gemmatimonadota bacterium]
MLDPAVERRLLGLLGLGIRGRLAVLGVDRVREAARNGSVRVAVVAADASRHSLEKVTRLLAAKQVPTITIASAAVLGGAAGRETTAVIGVVDAQLAKGIRALVDSTDATQKGSRRKG